MKIYFLQNENKEIIQDDFEKFSDNCQEIEQEDYHIVNGYNGALFFLEYTKTDEYKEKEKLFMDKALLNTFREERKRECFSIINRGALWYERLTSEQKTELEIWYQAWLDVTETKIEPIKPIWLE